MGRWGDSSRRMGPLSRPFVNSGLPVLVRNFLCFFETSCVSSKLPVFVRNFRWFVRNNGPKLRLVCFSLPLASTHGLAANIPRDVVLPLFRWLVD